MFLPHRLANNAAVGSALLGRVWIFTFVDLLFEESGVSKGSTGHTWTNSNQNTSACANIWCRRRNKRHIENGMLAYRAPSRWYHEVLCGACVINHAKARRQYYKKSRQRCTHCRFRGLNSKDKRERERLTTGKPPTLSLAVYPNLLAVSRSTPLIVSTSALPSSASSP